MPTFARNNPFSSALLSPKLLLPLLLTGAVTVGCGEDGSGALGTSSDPIYQDMKGRTLTWDGRTLSLDNKNTHKDPVKRVVVLSGVGSIPKKGEVSVLTDVTLNKISNKVHKCSGHAEREGDTLKIGLGGRSDRCKLFNGQWHLKGSGTLTQMQKATEKTNAVPSKFQGKYRGSESASIKITSRAIEGKYPKDHSENDREITLSFTSVKKTGDAYNISGDLNTVGQSGKTCQGTMSKSGSRLSLALSGNSRRCSMLSGQYK